MNYIGYFIIAIAIFFISIITIANSTIGVDVFSFVKYVPGGDKTLHFMLFGTMTLILTLALNVKPYIVSTLIFIIAFIEEVSQIWVESRTFDYMDLMADFMGIVIFSYIAFRFKMELLDDKR